MKKTFSTHSTFDEARERAAQRGDEFQYGSVARDLAAVPLAERLRYLPDGVLQYNNIMDTNGCASRSPVNIYKAKFTYWYHNGMHPALKAWLAKEHLIDGKNYSYVVGTGTEAKVVFDETFIEILSKTTPKGNSLKEPIHTAYEYGLTPECLPLEADMSWERYSDRKRVTQDMLDLAREFKRRFTTNYEQVSSADFEQATNDDYVATAIHAYGSVTNGIYQRTEAPFNHAVPRATNAINIFDNYPPFIKHLAKDYRFFDWGYSLSVTGCNPYPDEQITLFNLLKQFNLLSFFAEAWRRMIEPPTPSVTIDHTAPAEPVPTVPQAPSRLVQALIQVESGGDDRAIGDRNLTHKAYGCLQIRKPVCIDVNRRYGTTYKPEDMLGNRALSIKVFQLYMDIYATEQAIGRPVTDEDRARIWNGGPSAWKKGNKMYTATALYWYKVKTHL